MRCKDTEYEESQVTPQRVSFILYIYGASGDKLAKRQKDHTFIWYAGNMIYNNDKSLDYLLDQEGMVKKLGSSFTYEYYLKDHLSNTRVMFKDRSAHAVPLQVEDYYPFGSSFVPVVPDNDNKYLYNGKEKQDDVLGGVALDWYDYGARFYDPEIGRWTTVDPHAENYYSWSLYNYVANNPMILLDPDGKDWYQDKNGHTMWQKGNTSVNGYKDIGATYTQNIGGRTSVTYTQNEATSISTNSMSQSEWVSQYSKPKWGNTPANYACNKASNAMLANAGTSSKGIVVIVNKGVNERAGSANKNAPSAIKNMIMAIDKGTPTKVTGDFKNGSTTADGMGDHFVVVEGYTQTINNGRATSTTFRYFNPGNHNRSAGTSPSNTFQQKNGRLVHMLKNNGIHPTKCIFFDSGTGNIFGRKNIHMANPLHEKMLRHVEQWRNSGLSRKAYASEHGMTRYKFEYWIRKSTGETTPKDYPPEFIEITPHCEPQPGKIEAKRSTENPSAQLVLTFPSGLRLEIFG